MGHFVRSSNLRPSDCACHLDLERDVCLRDLTRENATENLVEGRRHSLPSSGRSCCNWLCVRQPGVDIPAKRFDKYECAQSSSSVKYRAKVHLCWHGIVVSPLELQSSYDVIALHESQTFPVHPESAYGWSKLMGEYEAELVNVTKRKDKSNLEIGLLCFHNLYGGGAEYADKLSSQALPAMIRKATACSSLGKN